MDFLSSLNISGSGMTAQKLRMDVISQNISNAEVTRTENGTPYRRKMVVLSSIDGSGSFRDALNKATKVKAAGVQVQSIAEDESDLVPVYNPNHPDAKILHAEKEGNYIYYTFNKRALLKHKKNIDFLFNCALAKCDQLK